jgi:hypothetical protein
MAYTFATKMIRSFIILLLTAALGACDRPNSDELSSKTFKLPDGPGNLSDDIAGHAAAGLAYAAKRKQQAEQSQYAPFAPLLRSDHAELTDEQWIQFCFKQIFQRLGFPFSASPGSGVRFDASTYTYTVTHSPEALAVYHEFLDDNNRSPSDRFNDLLNGGKRQGEPTGAGQPATRPVDKPEGSDQPQPEAEGRSR